MPNKFWTSFLQIENLSDFWQKICEYRAVIATATIFSWVCYIMTRRLKNSGPESRKKDERVSLEQMVAQQEQRKNIRKKSSDISRFVKGENQNFMSEKAQEDVIRRLREEISEQQQQLQFSNKLAQYSETLKAQRNFDSRINQRDMQQECEKQNSPNLKAMEEIYTERKRKADAELRMREEERKRSRSKFENEMALLRELSDRKEQAFEEEQKKQRIRREEEEKRLEEELRRVDEENRLKAEEFQKQMEEELARRNAYYDSILEELEKSTWSITIRTSFEARLNYLRSTPKRIQQYFWKLTETLSSLREHLQETENINQALLRILMVRVANLQKVLQYQADLMQTEILNLINMEEKTRWPFLQDIKNSLIVIQKSCEQMLHNLSLSFNFSNFDTAYLQTSESFAETERLFRKLIESYGNVPTMGFLEAKYRNQSEQ